MFQRICPHENDEGKPFQGEWQNLTITAKFQEL
jgi:hypothetical protein